MPTSGSLCFSVSRPNSWSLWYVSHAKVIINLTAMCKALISNMPHGCGKPGNLALCELGVWKDYGTVVQSKSVKKLCETAHKRDQPRAVSMYSSSRSFKSMCGTHSTDIYFATNATCQVEPVHKAVSSMVEECLFPWKDETVLCLFTLAYMLCLGSSLWLLARPSCCVTWAFLAWCSSHTSLYALTL